MICAKRDEKAFAAVESLIQKEITRLDIPAALLEEWAPKKKPTREKSSEPVAAQTSEPKADTGEKPTQQNKRRRDRRGNDNTVVGMGDHMPSFIALSFEERRAS